MKKTLRTLILGIIPVFAFIGPGFATCTEGLNEIFWNKTPKGYCEIFFPNCTQASLGKRLSYAREFAESEIICTGEKGEYKDFYKVTIREANELFDTNFTKIGINYTSELSQYLFENCQKHCGSKVIEPAAEVIPATKLEPAIELEPASETVPAIESKETAEIE